MSKRKPLTTAAGDPVSDNERSLTAGPAARCFSKTGSSSRSTLTSTAGTSISVWFTP